MVETSGRYKGRKLDAGLKFILPFVDRIAARETIREKVIDIPPQISITKYNLAITVDAVVYWQIIDLEKAYYKVNDIQSAIVNLVLTQIRTEMGKL